MLNFAELCVNLQPKLDKTILMKQIKAICILLAAIFTMASCVKDSDETILYDEAAITSFTLGTVNLYTVNDTATVKTTYTGSAYKFVIDQLNHQIYNPDSLPYGTDAKHILCSISTINNSVALYQGIGDEDKELYYYHSSTDSIDFSVPRTFRIVSSDGTGITDYTVKVNVHQEKNEPIIWKNVALNTTIASMTGMKAFYDYGDIHIFGCQGNETKIYTTTDGKTYSQVSCNVTFGADAWKNVVRMMDTFFILDNGKIYKSEYVGKWYGNDYYSPKTLKQLIGASSIELYALSTDNTLMVSGNDGLSWSEETLDSDAQFLPTQDIAVVTYPVKMTDYCEQILMVGNRSTTTYKDKTCVVWRKIIDFEDVLNSGQWTYLNRGGDDEYDFPSCNNINLLRYEDSTIGFYGKPYFDNDLVAYDEILQSRDNGITWKENSYYVMPDIGEDEEKDVTWTTSVVDGNNFIWIFCAGTGEVWKGRLNRVAWTNK